MKADWGLLGGAAAAMLAVPLLVLAWSGTPMGIGYAGEEKADPQQQVTVLPGSKREEPAPDPEKSDAFPVLSAFRILDETTGEVAEVAAADYVAGAIAA